MKASVVVDPCSEHPKSCFNNAFYKFLVYYRVLQYNVGFRGNIFLNSVFLNSFLVLPITIILFCSSTSHLILIKGQDFGREQFNLEPEKKHIPNMI